MKKFAIHLDIGDACTDCHTKPNFINAPDETTNEFMFYFTQCQAAMIRNPVSMSAYTLLS